MVISLLLSASHWVMTPPSVTRAEPVELAQLFRPGGPPPPPPPPPPGSGDPMPDSMPNLKYRKMLEQLGAEEASRLFYPRCSGLRRDSCRQLRAFPRIRADDEGLAGKPSDKPR